MQEHLQQSEKERPRVVMLLANSFEHDTRVYKEARSLIEWGCQVHVLALTGTELPLEEINDSILVHRLGYRKRDVLRLGIVILSWWCKPLVRLALGSYKFIKPFDRVENETIKSSRSLHKFLSSLKTKIKNLPGARNIAHNVMVIQGTRCVEWMATNFARIVRKIARVGLRIIRRIVYLIKRNIRFASNRIKRLAPSSLRLVAFNLQFARKALALDADVVLSHDLNMLLGGALVRRLSGIHLVYDSHELYLRRNIGNKSRAKDNIIWAPIERAFIGKCDAVMSVADGICEHLAKQYKINKPHLIRNVQPYESPQPKTTILADELNIPHNKKIIIYAGAITINRGLEAMIDSAKLLENAVYVIMGYARNPKYMQSLIARATEQGVLFTKVFFRDAVPINDVTRFVASSDLGIVPTQNVCLSYFFESSNKIFHCMMAGVPLAMSDHYEKRLLVEQYDIGVLFDETDPTKIACAVNEILADQSRYLTMRQNCFDAAKKMNWEHEQQKLRTIFGELLGSQAPSIPEIMIENSPSEHQSVTTPTQLLIS